MSPSLPTLLLTFALVQAPAAPTAPVTGVRLSGRVVDGETGKPLADAIVTLTPRAGRETAQKRTVNVSVTGTFQFTNVPRGAYRLHAEHSKPVVPYRSESLDLDVGERNLEDLGMILSPAIAKVSITGKVVVAGGGALPATLSSFRLSGETIALQRDGSFESRLRPFEKYAVVFPDGYYVESISSGPWDSAAGTWMLREGPASAVQITLGVGRRQISGRLFTANKASATQGLVTVTGPAPSTTPRQVLPGPGGQFSIAGLRTGDYVLRAQTGRGDSLQATVLPFALGAQNRDGLEIVLKEMTAIKGQVVVSGRTLEELMRFKPFIEVEDVNGKQRVAIDSKGNFDFKSFEGAYTVAIRELPIELRVQSITPGPSSVTIRVSTLQGDSPDFFRSPQIKE